MDNTTDNVSDAVVKKETVNPTTRPTDKEIIDQLIKQAKFAEDHYCKLVSQFEENLRKTLLKGF